jgi:4a-hydroxytetrahydrobiopterin dehydratase
MADNLAQKKCEPCEGGVDPLTREQFEPYLEQVSKWTVRDDKFIEREFQFKDFVEALAWVNKVGEIAEEEGHHPDILIHGWNKVRITLWTHAIDGLSINDFIVASRIDRM